MNKKQKMDNHKAGPRGGFSYCNAVICVGIGLIESHTSLKEGTSMALVIAVG